VLTIENARSGDEMVHSLAAAGYGRDIGPGVGAPVDAIQRFTHALGSPEIGLMLMLMLSL
jgi:hypothetical protein